MLTKYDGSALTTAPVALTTRLAEVYRQTGSKVTDFMNEVKALTDKDKADFKQWFNDAGYPIV